MQVKQIIIIRKDLRNKEGNKVRSGKIIAQACHASIAFLTSRIRNGEYLTDVEKYWVENDFTKVCLGVNSESELLDLHKKCLENGLVSKLILDSGKTEFSEHTYTCLGVGPDVSEKLNQVCGHLSLY
jgi:peptidyl-tRNA hydrolase, PTH2 family